MLIGIGIMTLVIGIIFKLFPPKKINGIYGYRTTISMKDQKSWDIAQRLGAYSFIIVGLFHVVLGSIFYILKYNNETIQLIIFLVLMISMIIVDEIILKKKIG